MQLCAATNRFLAISPNVISADIPKRIREIALIIRDRSRDEAQKVAAMQADEALKYIMSVEESNRPLKLAFEELSVIEIKH
jgi:hypothetical protein